MINIKRYTDNDAPLWDAFVRKSRNGTFLFERAYMDYHKDRFQDHSLIFFDDKEHIIALLPANETEGVLWSHQGLTYGGLILGVEAVSLDVRLALEATIEYARQNGFSSFYYKQVPDLYHLCPTQEADYFLWRIGAQMHQVLLSATVPLRGEVVPSVERRRRRGWVKANEMGYIVQNEASLEEFWPIMVENLQVRYGSAPVHSLAEMQLLQQRFPQQIRCSLVRNAQGMPVAGAVVYEANHRAVHVQYGHANEEGKSNGALDLLYLSLIDHYRRDTTIEFFDFGTSNEQGGRYLNENLIVQKEGFGARGVAYKTWYIQIR